MPHAWGRESTLRGIPKPLPLVRIFLRIFLAEILLYKILLNCEIIFRCNKCGQYHRSSPRILDQSASILFWWNAPYSHLVTSTVLCFGTARKEHSCSHSVVPVQAPCSVTPAAITTLSEFCVEDGSRWNFKECQLLKIDEAWRFLKDQTKGVCFNDCFLMLVLVPYYNYFLGGWLGGSEESPVYCWLCCEGGFSTGSKANN